MHKKIIAAVALLAVLAGLIFGVSTSASATDNYYQVGFARVDINPYVNGKDMSEGIFALPLRGSSNVWNRLSTNGVLDDNGDGTVDERDGLKATCIAVTDTDGTTALFITADLIGGTLYSQLASAICARIAQEQGEGNLTDVKLTQNQIFYSGTHTHSAPDTTAYNASNRPQGTDTVNANLGEWIDRTIENICDAAVLALEDRAAATVTKDQISPSEVPTTNSAYDKVLCSTRHYSGQDNTGETYYSGDNFNGTTVQYEVDGVQYSSSRGADPKQVTDADQTMYFVNFNFDNDEKLPIVMVGWRGHPSLNNTNDLTGSNKNAISSDYVNTFRHALEYGVNVQTANNGDLNYVKSWSYGTKQSCRVGFFQGTGGSVNPRGYELIKDAAGNLQYYQYSNTKKVIKASTWIEYSASANSIIENRACPYGVVLADFAQAGLRDDRNETAVPYGKIQVLKNSFSTQRKTVGVTALSYAAAKAYQAAVAEAESNNTTVSLPYIYTDTASGEKFVISSSFHATAIVNDWDKNSGTSYSSGSSVTVNAIMMGNGLAFVVIPGEPFDYYYKDYNSTQPEDNLWNILDSEDTYGKPFVLGYCNGAKMYFPNYQAYFYNSESTSGKYAVGSYETHTSDYAPGTGEKMVYKLKQMLSVLDNGSREAYCQHCKKSVTWQPFDGTTTVSGTVHYYLCSDYTCGQIGIGKEKTATVCFDLNGYTLTGDTRAFYVYKQSTLNLMDSSDEQTGYAKGQGNCAGTGFGGATVLVDAYGTMNFYSGNLDDAMDGTSVQKGGVLRIAKNATFNMYAGTIHGGVASSFKGSYLSGNTKKEKTSWSTGSGGTVSVSGTMNIYGGTVKSGQMTDLEGTVTGGEKSYHYTQVVAVSADQSQAGLAVDTSATLLLAGQASVEKIYLADGTAANLTVQGAYTGTAKLIYPSGTKLTENVEVGTAAASATGVAADVTDAVITIEGSQLTVAVKEDKLVLANDSRTFHYCNVCKDFKQWTTATDDYFTKNYNAIEEGHYVLSENVTAPQVGFNIENKDAKPIVRKTYCVDMAGHSYTSTNGRAFYTYKGTTLNIQDSVGGGTLEGKSKAWGAGVLYVAGNSTVNLYGGTVKAVTGSASQITNGGAACIYGGTFNVYGGTVKGGTVTESGGAVSLKSGGTLNIYGGTIESGTAASGGNSVYVYEGTVTISGDAVVADVAVKDDAWANSFTVDTSADAFTGTVQLTFEEQPTVGAVVGAYVAGNSMDEALVTLSGSDLGVIPQGEDLIVASVGADIYANDEKATRCLSVSSAIEKYTYTEANRNYIKLLADTSEPITVSHNTYLDLNGYCVSGAVTVEDGAVLYCMDSQTDDYTVADGKYGKLCGSVTGTVEAVPFDTVSSVEDKDKNDMHRAGYLMVERDEGISFHRVNLKITAMSLRSKCVGVYYKSNFIGDEVVADETVSFGIALSVYDAPSAEIIDTYCAYSGFSPFVSGKDGNVNTSTGTLLQNIMKTENTPETNAENAQMDIYGCAYIKTKDGYLFGKSDVRSLKKQVVAINGIWGNLTDVQKNAFLDMYEKYETVIKTWEIPVITAAYEKRQTQ